MAEAAGPPDHPASDPFERAAASAAVLQERTGRSAYDAAVVLGSGWMPAAESLAETAGAEAIMDVAFSDFGGYPPPTVAGHGGAVRSMSVGDRGVLVFLGRVHLYEGHPPATVVHGVRTAAALGCRSLILTNAAGGLSPYYRVGQPVLIKDHLNLTGASPLEGPPPPAGYPGRFVDLTDLYSTRLRTLARGEDPSLLEGTYAAMRGPHYETPAEIAMLQGFGADLVGMSTVLEAIAGRHLGMEVLGMSLVTNVAAGLSEEAITHAEVVSTGAAAAATVGALLGRILLRL